MSKCRIIIADDSSIFRECLKSLLRKDPENEIVGEASTGIELLALLKSVECNLALIDIAMPDMDGFTALKEIKREYPQLKVLTLSMLNDYSHFAQARALGASGYLVKDEAGDEIVGAIKKILGGKMFVSPSVKTLLAERHAWRSEDLRKMKF